VQNITELVGAEVQGWTLLRVLGAGADGIVYEAHRDGCSSAFKLFFPESLLKNGPAEARERLELQLSLKGQKHHPNLVEVYDGGEDKGLDTLFLVMELVPGQSLDKLAGKVPSGFIPHLVKQLASAAEFLETRDLFHRDIKPANVVISDDFETLTLLDLGVVYQLPVDDQDGRLSGKEFVATLRYSPPEFVWRNEQSNADGAWKAVTFYQIGATIHDMVMGRPLFSGQDQPRARLYDCVRESTPSITGDPQLSWLIQVAHACLLKDWRQRLQLVTWSSFSRPPADTDSTYQERDIRLRQIRQQEMREAFARSASVAPTRTREQELWHMNTALFLEIRTYLLDSSIFPRFRVTETSDAGSVHVSKYEFEADYSKGFTSTLVVTLETSISQALELATTMTFEATYATACLQKATWTEMFTVETAFSLCRKALLDTVEQLLPKE
jgi:serine/threonine protein kinase